jgi:hypothetical protein
MVRMEEIPPLIVGLNAVIIAVTRESPRVLTIAHGRGEAAAKDPLAPEGTRDLLPYGPLDPRGDRTLELTLRGWVHSLTGLELGYVEQLYTFADRDRGAGARGRSRVLSVAYLALVREDRPSGSHAARWRDWYSFFPWEDWRKGQPAILTTRIAPALQGWIADAPRGSLRTDRRVRADVAFALDGASWDSDRVLERYELLYEIGLVEEARRDRGLPEPAAGEEPLLGEAMELDHRRILATAMGRMRGKLRYRPVVFELLPETFTLLRLQRVVEALAGLPLHKQNFRRLVEQGGLVEGTGKMDSGTGGRPAEFFRFRREVIRERRAPGVRLPTPR